MSAREKWPDDRTSADLPPLACGCHSVYANRKKRQTRTVLCDRHAAFMAKPKAERTMKEARELGEWVRSLERKRGK